MNILIAGNDNYVLPTIVLLTSICRNNSEDIKVFFLYNCISDKNKKEIDTIAQKYPNICINYIYINPSLFETAPVKGRTNDYITKETYFRLTAGELLPSDIDRVLYLDTDIIVNGSLKEFYYHDFSEASIALVCKDFGLEMANKLKKEIYRNMNLRHDHIYFNAGVMLINLKQLRKNYALQDFLSFINKHSKEMIFHDQDVMNKMFELQLEYEDYNRYNCRPFFYPINKKSKALIKEAIIIHYGEKPWNSNFSDMAGDLFWKYAIEAGLKSEEQSFKRKNDNYLKLNRYNIFFNQTKRNLKLFYLRKIRGIR